MTNSFGAFGGDLLVGNLHDSKVNAYNLMTDHFDGSFTVDTSVASSVGLWALDFGNGTSGLADTLYFTSGINDQKDGLFGSITSVPSVPEPSTALLLALGLLELGTRRHTTKARRRERCAIRLRRS